MLERDRRAGIYRRLRTGRTIEPRPGAISGSRTWIFGRGGQPSGNSGVLCVEFACDVGDSGGGTAQALPHCLHIGQNLADVRCELLGERAAHVVVAPATFGLFQAIAQSGMGLLHPVGEFGQPYAPLAQNCQVQSKFAAHIPQPGKTRPPTRRRNRRSKSTTKADNGTDELERSTAPSSAT